MNRDRVSVLVSTALYGEPQIRELLARDDADETFEDIAAVLPTDHPEPELTVILTGLAVLRAREAAERRSS